MLRLNSILLIVLQAHFVQKLVQFLLAFRRMAVKPRSESLRIPVPAVSWVSKESVFASTYRASRNIRVFHRVGGYHSLPMMLTDLRWHLYSFSVAASPMTVPIVNPLHRLSAL